MYKLLIVDDEEIEREGMAQLIPWEEYEIQLVCTAWNGIEAYELIKSQEIDIVITDIKMPGMNGIEFIRKTIADYPNILFIILSGYGEFEFTSQAMELGVKHYILKPYNEVKIKMTIEEVKKELKKLKEQIKNEQRYHKEIKRLLPRAKEQAFRELLIGGPNHRNVFLDDLVKEGKLENDFCIVAFHTSKRLDYLEQFVIYNILEELIGGTHIYAAASIYVHFIILIDANSKKRFMISKNKLLEEYRKYEPSIPLQVVLSDDKKPYEVQEMYQQTLSLLQFSNIEKAKQLLTRERFHSLKSVSGLLFDLSKVEHFENYEELLFEISLTFLKMQLMSYSLDEMKASWICLVNMNLKSRETIKDADDREKKIMEVEKQEDLYENVVITVKSYMKKINSCEKETVRIQAILLEIFKHIGREELNIHFLSKEVLYISEDYFGKLFHKYMHQRYSSFVLETRVKFAKKLMEFHPQILITDIAKIIGFPSDGQYFSKVFKKITGSSPSEYREMIQAENKINPC